MRLFLTTEARTMGIANPVIALYQNVSLVSKEEAAKAYDPIINTLMSRIGTIKDTVLKSPEVTGFRELFKNLGYPKSDPAGERLLRSAEKKGTLSRYGNLVDAYNIAGLEFVAPIGVHDASKILKIKTDLIFRRAFGTETLIPSFAKKTETIPRGDFTYGFMEAGKFVPLAWLGQKDVDNRDFQLNDSTTSFILTAIGNANTSQDHNIKICKRVFKLLQLTCPDANMTLLVPESEASFKDQSAHLIGENGSLVAAKVASPSASVSSKTAPSNGDGKTSESDDQKTAMTKTAMKKAKKAAQKAAAAATTVTTSTAASAK